MLGRKLEILTLSVVAVLIVAQAAQAGIMDRRVPVTYRDFHGQFTDNDALAHPDFENESFFHDACGLGWDGSAFGCLTIGDPTLGIVATALGPDGTPQLDGGDMVTSAETFFEWYHDSATEGSGAPNPRMMKIAAYMLLSSQGDGSFVFDSDDVGGFFPIDEQGFGNTPRGPETRTPPNTILGRQGDLLVTGHNFHFTTMLATPFVFDPSANHTFEFSGDDDVWIFLDGRLVIDIGGIHQEVTQTITIDNALTDVDGNLLNLVDGQTYQFSMFHAERHRNDSNFRIETTLPLGEEVPEPAAMVMLLVGAACILGRRRR